MVFIPDLSRVNTTNMQKEEPYDAKFDKFMKLGEKLGFNFTFIPADNNRAQFVNHPCQEGSKQQEREKMIKKFKDGSLNLLVSTNPSDVQSRKQESQQGFPSSSVLGTEWALVAEHQRIQKCRECKLSERKKTYVPEDKLFLKIITKNKIQQILGAQTTIKSKATELVDILNQSPCPRFVSNSVFAKQILAACERRMSSYSGLAFAYAQFIVLVTSQVPEAMDFLLCELHRLCIYTVPKHIEYSESAFPTNFLPPYCETIGFQKKEGKIESHDSYVERLAIYMGLYGALVQTVEVDGVQNSHGIDHGWAWLMRFIMGLPANEYTLVALESFLRTAGFNLHNKYKFHFTEVLETISQMFLGGLKTEEDQNLARVVAKIHNYIEGEEFLQEPEGYKVIDVKALHAKAPQLIIMESLGIY